MNSLNLFTQFIIDNGSDPDGVATVDVNNDNLTDVVVGLGTGSPGGLVYYPNTGSGFGSGVTMVNTESHLMRSLHSCADVENDGDVDFIIYHPHTGFYWVKNTGSGFQEIHFTNAQEMLAFFIDVDCDGWQDVMSIESKWFRDTTGNGDFVDQGHLFSNIEVVGYDLNLDGAEDLIRTSDTLAFSLNDSMGNFSPFVVIDAPPQTFWAVNAGDLDCDGDIDILYFRDDTIFIALDTVSLPLPHIPCYKIAVVDTFKHHKVVGLAIANMDKDYSWIYPINDIIAGDSLRAVWFRGDCQPWGINEYSGPKDFVLYVIFNGQYAVFRYEIFSDAGAYISVFDNAGRKLYERELGRRRGSISWGSDSSAGIYFCVLKAENHRVVKKFFKL